MTTRRHNQREWAPSPGKLRRMLRAMQRGYLSFRPLYPLSDWPGGRGVVPYP